MHLFRSLVPVAFAMILFFTTSPLHAQRSGWRHFSRPEMVTAIIPYSISVTDGEESIEGSFTEVGVGLGWSIPVYEIGEDLALAVAPSLMVATSAGISDAIVEEEDRFPLTMSLEGGLFASVKYGADAVWNTRKTFMAGAGIGAWYTALTTLDPYDITASYTRPAIMAEVGAKLGKTPVKFRYARILGAGEETEPGWRTEEVKVSLDQQSFQLIITFGL